MAYGWIELDKKNSAGPTVLKKVFFLFSFQWARLLLNSSCVWQVANIEDEVQVLLKKISSLQLEDVAEKAIQDLKKRKLIVEV